ncbi:SusC/RagA family TonB-linked outer membrane protein [Pedobacter heparinus]|uniref:TonB-dependent receptor plug n=1 Tax=Pedobacter heparinus (strain ATCC 13125 / DSM 2366 / CIP 104194 / JCM 7457 / NBRC 12017 / NCIMB 9290 / NRRL B-14731 / HIM 762-3) TaxID=485917 RepID=C6XWM8_PEDHD|nr:TonB-dependent receptor [Pedobacter heparinus]ACU06317.1 TonB-dependent receptor plug [Pedobacter heparinus DSM 2366]
MKKKLLILFLSTFLLAVQAIAQQITITGTVSSADGPIPGVSIRVKGTTMVAQTGGDGKYAIKAAANDVLVFSYVGYTTLERNVGSSSTINVNLVADNNGLDEVVVVGFGTQKKESLTGAVSSVNVEKVFGNRPLADVGRGLQGAVPGLSIVVPSGEVGSDPIIKIRGQIGSIVGSNSPLILVDNVEIPSIQYVNPNDIESISVLKDAASSAIYGSKAAFGVILITTKKGAKVDGSRVTYSNNFVWQSPFKPIDIAGIDGLEYTLDAHENMKQPGPAGGFWRIDRTSFGKIKEWQAKYGDVVGNNDPIVYGRDWFWDGAQKFGYRIYDPVEAMIKDHGLSQIHNLGLNGKSGNTSYNLSVGYLGQEGMMKPAKHDDYRRFIPALTLSTKATDYLTVRGGVRYADATKRNPYSLNVDAFTADPWLYLYRWSRLFPIGVQEQGEDIIDPAFSARMSNDQIRDEKYLNMNLGTTINITKAWDVQADYAYSTENNLLTYSVPYVQGRTTWYGVETLRDANGQVYVDENGNITDSGGMPAYRFPLTDHTLKANTSFSQNNYRSKRSTFNVLTNYNLDLGNHQFKFLLGSNIVAFDYSSQFSYRSNLLNNDNPQYNFALGGTEKSGGGANWDSQAGFFGRINYAYKDKYLFEATLRRDGSSKFPTHLRWRSYPGVSGGWVISNENFMESIKPVLSFAKLRASWGSIGDQLVPNSLYLPVMDPFKSSWLNSSANPYYYLATPDPVSGDVSWQNIEHMNLGVDLRFFNNKLGITAEVFQRNTNDMIMGGDALPATFGASAPEGNYGNLRTRGWELNIDFNHQFDNGLRLSIDANLSDAVTIITKGPDYKNSWENRLLSSTFSTGRRYGDVYGFVTDRLFQADDFVYDANGKFVQTNIVYNGTSKTTNKLAGDNPVYQTYFEDGNQTLLISPGDVKFKDLNGDGYIDAGKGTNGDPGDRVVIGNITPRYQYGFRLGADFKGFDLSVFFQGVGERKIWGSGQLAIPGYFAKEGAMPQAIAGDYWKPDRTGAFYPRAWNMNGANEGYVMRTQSKYMLDMSYLKIKNITFGYNLPASVLKKIKLANARVYISLENFITFDNLRGLPIDPEAISGYSILRSEGNYNLGRTGTSNPAFKSASAGLQIGF